MKDSICGIKVNYKANEKLSEQLETLEVFSTLKGFRVGKNVYNDDLKSSKSRKIKTIIFSVMVNKNTHFRLIFVTINNDLVEVKLRHGNEIYSIKRSKNFKKVIEKLENLLIETG